DLGFILLGFLAADVGGGPLDVLFDRIMVRLMPTARLEADGDPGLTFQVPSSQRGLTAPTEPLPADPRPGRRLVGGGHHHYAAAPGGVAGHAGLFGTAAAVGAFARAMLRADDMIRVFTTRSAVPGSSRALGWDTMLPTSSCGTRMSQRAYGHVGFTG